MNKNFEVSLKKDGVFQARIVRAENADMAERYFRHIEPTAEVYGVSKYCGTIKPGMPVEEVPPLFTGIVFEESCDRADVKTRTLYFDVPKEYLGEAYLADEPDAVSAEISIEFDHEIVPTYYDTRINISPVNKQGSSYDWTVFEMDSDMFEDLMSLANEPFRHSLICSYHYDFNDGTVYDEIGLDLEDLSDTVGIVNYITTFFIESKFKNPVVDDIKEG